MGRTSLGLRRNSLLALGALALALALTLPNGTARADWKPTKPISIIVPWSAGG